MKTMKFIILEKLLNSVIKNNQNLLNQEALKVSNELQNKDALLDTCQSLLIEIESVKKELATESTKKITLHDKKISLEKKVNCRFNELILEDKNLKKIVNLNKLLEEEKLELDTKKKTLEENLERIKIEKEINKESGFLVRNYVDRKVEEIDAITKLLSLSKKDSNFSEKNLIKLEEKLENKITILNLKKNELVVESKHADEVEAELRLTQFDIDELEAQSVDLKLIIENIKESHSKNEKNIKEINKDTLQLDGEIEESLSLIKSEKSSNVELKEEVKKSTNRLNLKKDELMKRNIELSELKSLKESLDDENHSLNSTFDRVDAEIISAVRVQKKLSRNNDKLTSENEALSFKLKKQGKELSREEKSREIFSEQNSELTTNLRENKVKLEANKVRMDELESDKRSIRSLVDSKTVEVESLNLKIDKLSKTLTLTESSNIELSSELEELSESESKLSAKNIQLSTDLAEFVTSVSEKKNEINTLSNKLLMESKSNSYIKKELESKTRDLEKMLKSEENLSKNLARITKAVTNGNIAIEEIQLKNDTLEKSNTEKGVLLSNRNKELILKRKQFKRNKEEFSLHSDRRNELDSKNREVTKELAEIELLLRVENSRENSLNEETILEEKNESLRKELEIKRLELADLVDDQENRNVVRKISRNC